ncbi:MAG: KH domain-containing protein [Deltaproteobacteria bacterium]|nr:KH domain-containing protein [Deltaproteobacteria bacterium]
MKGLVEVLARSLVDNPAPVEVAEQLSGDDAIFRLKVGKDDLGKVIGKKGRTAKAFRTLLSAAGAKQNLRVTLEIVEPEGSRRGGGAPAEAPPEAAEAAPVGEDT